VQLASALDLRALRIGGYQAHMERFLGRLVAELNVDFPWVTTSVELYQNRVREERGVRVVHGDLKQAFEDGDVDYMLEPEDQGNVSPFPPVYRYSFRVVATEDRLREVRRTQKKGRAEGSHITDLHGKKLLLAPEGHSSRRRIESLLKKYHVEPADRVPVPTPLMLRVRALAGEGYAIISDEYGPIGSAQERFPALLVDHDVDSDYASTFTVPMILRVRDGLSGGIHAALATVVERLSEEEGRRPEARFSAVF
jgi:hypothetical protein